MGESEALPLKLTDEKVKLTGNDTIASLKIEGLGSVYPSMTNSGKKQLVCRPLRVGGIHDGYNKKE